ncbi:MULTISPECIES: rhombotarget lipoprotein [Vibrio]|uniref:rhombotarget lipoprotein n=1 Tax=Vibrio TaxID=662 RepID=UPI002075BD76|nr:MULTISPECIES: rhombotarget lipoprotein [Vibrio]USD33803.1 rhombotarget lipoprotein [Vibrio sp. SCSIO 43186]USD46903.1 rhombotarget lipoprotein [Vibrio sp. SCSIO 43145]USD70927.1 rhombotarget lipoprotein [Vibrio sp. SCSIO 43139]USD95832.1 rhombotarget lipoprotein [Vibrio coralliilyticus]
MKKIAFIFALSFFIFGCSGLGQSEETASSSLVDFLYPNTKDYQEHQPTIPHLVLPVNVGIAFVPSSKYGKLDLSSKRKHEILSKVKNEFLGLDYVNRIEIISDPYLRSGGGFDNLKQISRLYDVQVMALVSYDQVARSSQNNAALLYWTIVGMYLIPGDQNTTQTFVDTAVFDINSSKLLFRAPGLSNVGSLSTAVGIEETFYENSEKGFDLAVTDMVNNLGSELDLFKIRIKEEKVANVSYDSGYSGGSIHWFVLVVLASLSLFRKKATKRSRRTHNAKHF